MVDHRDKLHFVKGQQQIIKKNQIPIHSVPKQKKKTNSYN